MTKSKTRFNPNNEKGAWSGWSWNPVTGCLYDCEYCYGRPWGSKIYSEKYEPTPRFERLAATQNTKVPDTGNIIDRIVFTVDMGDLFGDWVPSDWINQVLEAVRKAPEWIFAFLTKNPKRLVDIDFPKNAWVGATVDKQFRVEPTEEAFKQLKATVKYISCEPLLEELVFSNMELFDWLIIGPMARPRNRRQHPIQPSWRWVKSLVTQAREAKVKVFYVPTLEVPQGEERLKEHPDVPLLVGA